uniref:Uncharacterized protein n=1 Tax=Vespula pensylvanica TaxID=30213 RepID=A0A834P923_VESPE|nr:hypothetical protein H0235_002130 [Vespula pensylvanica]
MWVHRSKTTRAVGVVGATASIHLSVARRKAREPHSSIVGTLSMPGERGFDQPLCISAGSRERGVNCVFASRQWDPSTSH